MKNLKTAKLSTQEMQKLIGGVHPNVEKPIFRQEFGQQAGKNR